MLTITQLKKALPLCNRPEDWLGPLNIAFEKYEIKSAARISAFLAQVGYESGQLNRLEEGLIYRTSARLMKIWPKRFRTEASALPYVNNPSALANFVYADRLGNGPFQSGDGYTFRGRGLIQITGRSNYTAAGKALGIDAVGHPELLALVPHAAMGAAWFWYSHGLNELADDNTSDDDLEDFGTITLIINGAKTGLQDRLALYKSVEVALA